MEGPLFVVSMWRSGSSLLYALLNKHPQVGLMFEGDLHLIRQSFWRPWRSSVAARWQFWSLALSRHRIDAIDIGTNCRTFHETFTAVYQQFSARKGATIWGDKSPNYYDQLTVLSKEFWNARFIVVWRDPIGTANAIARAANADAAYFKKSGIQLRALLGRRILRQQCDQLLAEGRAVCQIRYEDLIREPEPVMRQVCAFLQIPFIAEVGTLQNADRSTVPAGAHHAALRGETILTTERPDILDTDLRNKIVRYKNWWRLVDKESCDSSGLPIARSAERAWDKICYRALRFLDALTRMGFSWLPLSLLLQYRKFRFRSRRERENLETESRKSGFVYEL
jgi:hypothetical protein